LNPGNW